MKNLSWLFFFLLTFQTFAQKKVLIYTHNGKGYVHENISASVAAIKKVCNENGYAAESSDDPAIFDAARLKGISCIIFCNTNNEAFDTEAQKQAFVDYIHSGGGFVGIHSASGSERKWPWFAAMLGGRFVRHPELQKFTIKVIDKNHTSTKFLEDSWQWEDECYYLDQLNPDLHILLAADLTTIKDDKKATYPGTVFGNYFPLAWYHEFEGGRQFYTALGHKSEYYTDLNFIRHLTGGIKWAMRE